MHRLKETLRLAVLALAFAALTQNAYADSLNLYWINGFGSWFGRANVEVDGRKAGVLKAGKQLRIAVGPGPHEVRLVIPLSFQSAKLSVDVSGEHYLKVTMDMDGIVFNPTGPMPMFRMNFRPVSKEQALADVAKKRMPEAATAELGEVIVRRKDAGQPKDRVSR